MLSQRLNFPPQTSTHRDQCPLGCAPDYPAPSSVRSSGPSALQPNVCSVPRPTVHCQEEISGEGWGDTAERDSGTV